VANKETTARIKINELLEAAGWRFFMEGSAPANIRLEPSVTIKSSDLDALGDNFEKTSKGFIDFLLLDTKGFPLIPMATSSPVPRPHSTPRSPKSCAWWMKSRPTLSPSSNTPTASSCPEL
jgi:type I restriction enzyme R subunit